MTLEEILKLKTFTEQPNFKVIVDDFSPPFIPGDPPEEVERIVISIDKVNGRWGANLGGAYVGLEKAEVSKFRVFLKVDNWHQSN